MAIIYNLFIVYYFYYFTDSTQKQLFLFKAIYLLNYFKHFHFSSIPYYVIVNIVFLLSLDFH